MYTQDYTDGKEINWYSGGLLDGLVSISVGAIVCRPVGQGMR